MCMLVYVDALTMMKKANVNPKHHYNYNHASLDELQGQVRLDKV